MSHAQVRKTDVETSPDRSKCDSAKTMISEEDGGQRKHHKLWTISEVRKLIDGVSEYGVGRWTQIKRLLFSSSVHRTPVDLKVRLLFLSSVITLVECKVVLMLSST